jgi:hypothetical protein
MYCRADLRTRPLPERFSHAECQISEFCDSLGGYPRNRQQSHRHRDQQSFHRPLRVAAIWRTRLGIYLSLLNSSPYLVHHITAIGSSVNTPCFAPRSTQACCSGHRLTRRIIARSTSYERSSPQNVMYGTSGNPFFVFRTGKTFDSHAKLGPPICSSAHCGPSTSNRTHLRIMRHVVSVLGVVAYRSALSPGTYLYPNQILAAQQSGHATRLII